MTDTSMQGLTRSIKDIGEAFAAFKETNDERLQAIDSGNESLASELNEKLGKIEDALSSATQQKKDIEIEMELQRDRIEELEARGSRPGKTAAEQLGEEHKSEFIDWLSDKGQSPSRESKLQDLQRKLMEYKSVTIGSNPGGGFAVPEEIAREIERYFFAVETVAKDPEFIADFEFASKALEDFSAI